MPSHWKPTTRGASAQTTYFNICRCRRLKRYRDAFDFDFTEGEDWHRAAPLGSAFLTEIRCGGCEAIYGHWLEIGAGSITSHVNTAVPNGAVRIGLAGVVRPTDEPGGASDDENGADGDDERRIKRTQLVRVDPAGFAEATFKDLPPGQYRVTVRAVMDLEHNEKPCKGRYSKRDVTLE